jgi:hypothetical protein
MYPKTDERTMRIQVIDKEIAPLYAQREELSNAINILLLERRILSELEVLDEAETGNINLANTKIE